MKQRLWSGRLIRVLLIVISLPLLTDFAKTIVRAGDGDLDPAFGNGGIVITDFGHDEDVSVVLVQRDGKVLGVGSAISGVGFTLARYNANGTLDSTFGVAGEVVTNFFGSTQTANGAVLQPDGKIVVGGTAFKTDHYVFALARYNIDGSLDPSFGMAGIVDADLFAGGEQISGIGLRQDGKIVAVGVTFASGSGNSGMAVARYNPNGSLDSGFGMGGKVFVNTIVSGIGATRTAFQPDNKIILGGFAIPFGINGADFTLLRLNADGSVDPSFGTNGEVTTDFSNSNDFLYALTLQPDGKIIAAGGAPTPSSVIHTALARYNSDGSLDNTFGVGGKVISGLHAFFDQAKAVAVQSDGRIVVAVHSFSVLVARYNHDGALDQTFGAGGVSTTVLRDDGLATPQSLAIQSDGGIVAGGIVLSPNTGSDYFLLRIRGTAFDFCLQDDSGGGVLQVNLTTGAYHFSNCRGVTLGGTGSIAIRGCSITLQGNSSDRRVLVKIDTCRKTGTGSIQFFAQGTTFSILDRNTDNNMCACASSP